MTLQNRFEQELNRPGSCGRTSVVASEGPREVRCDVAELNPLAASVERLELNTPELFQATAVDLERIARSLAERLTYLMEPISPIEVDAAACVVQMRSNPPQQDDDGRTYYELLVRSGGLIALARYRKENGAPRQHVPATMTREVLLRVVGDFAAVLE
jgi:hypothetical protein